jgi:hypothetical protein
MAIGLAQARPDGFDRVVQYVRLGVVEDHVQAAGRENQRDAAPHQPGPDDRCPFETVARAALPLAPRRPAPAPRSACGVAAVEVEDLAGQERRGVAEQQQESAGQVLWLRETAQWHAGEHRLAGRAARKAVLASVSYDKTGLHPEMFGGPESGESADAPGNDLQIPFEITPQAISAIDVPILLIIGDSAAGDPDVRATRQDGELAAGHGRQVTMIPPFLDAP